MWWSSGHASMRIWVWSPAPTPRSQPWWYTLVNLSTGQPDAGWPPRLTSYGLAESVWAPGFMKYFVLKNKVESNWTLAAHLWPPEACVPKAPVHVCAHTWTYTQTFTQWGTLLFLTASTYRSVCTCPSGKGDPLTTHFSHLDKTGVLLSPWDQAHCSVESVQAWPWREIHS